MTFSEAINKIITTEAEAKAFIDALDAAGNLFHFDDDPTAVGSFENGEWAPCFSEDEAHQVGLRVDEMNNDVIWDRAYGCPIGYALTLINEGE